MLKALTSTEFYRIVQNDLPLSLPTGFAAKQILFREIHNPDEGAAQRYKLRDIPRPLTTGAYDGIQDFAMKVAGGWHDGIGQDNEEDKWLAITVSRPSYIVLRLSPDEGSWTFTGQANQAAVTLGELPNPDPQLYGALHYVTPTSVSQTPARGCTVVYFAAMPGFGSPTAPCIQKVNYIVDVQGGSTNLMDPDIRHPGNGVS